MSQVSGTPLFLPSPSPPAMPRVSSAEVPSASAPDPVAPSPMALPSSTAGLLTGPCFDFVSAALGVVEVPGFRGQMVVQSVAQAASSTSDSSSAHTSVMPPPVFSMGGPIPLSQSGAHALHPSCWSSSHAVYTSGSLLLAKPPGWVTVHSASSFGFFSADFSFSLQCTFCCQQKQRCPALEGATATDPCICCIERGIVCEWVPQAGPQARGACFFCLSSFLC